MTEICDNAVDDDGDGLVDAFDPDCLCDGRLSPNLVPNGQFNQTTGCCTDLGQVNCLTDWVVLGPSPDYISDNCPDNNLRPDVRFLANALNQGAENDGYIFGVIQMVDGRQFTESMGICLNNPMEVGKTYEVSFQLANLRNDSPDLLFSLVGINSCSRLGDYDTRGNNSFCELGLPFTRLGAVNARDLTQGWNVLTFEIIPEEEIEAIFYTVDCGFSPSANNTQLFMVMDEVSIREQIDPPTVPDIVQIGEACQEVLNLKIPAQIGASYQWYRDSIPIIGATDTLLSLIEGSAMSSGIYQVLIHDLEGNCDLTEPFELILPELRTQILESICAGEVYNFGESLIDAEGIYLDTMNSVWGCDSIVELQLEIRGNSVARISQTICPGESFVFGGIARATTGQYQDTLVNTLGCDSILILDLTVMAEIQSNISATICRGEQFVFGGQVFTEEGRYRDTLPSVMGCDSILLLDLMVIEEEVTNFSVRLCEGEAYSFGNEIVSAAGVYRDTLVNGEGCDSISVLELEVLPTQETLVSVSICEGDSYPFGGNTLITAGVYQQVLESAQGCDSIVILELTVLEGHRSNLSATICAGDFYIFGDTTLSTNGIYRDTLLNTVGCDSVIELQLDVLSLTTTFLSEEICEGDVVEFGGSLLSTSGLYRDTMTSSTGCDSLLFLELVVLGEKRSFLSASICEGEGFHFGSSLLNQAGVYEDTIQTIAGCDSIVTLDLSVLGSALGDTLIVSQPIGTSFNFANNIYFSAGLYEAVLTGSNGCDSTAFLSLSFFDPCEVPIQIDVLVEGVSCSMANNGRLEMVINGEFPPFQYAVEQDNFQSDPIFTNLESGNYSITVQDDFGCNETVIVTVPVKDQNDYEVALGNDTTIFLGESALLEVLGINFPAIQNLWLKDDVLLCQDCMEWVVSPAVSSVYTFQGIDEFGCLASAEIRIEVIAPPEFYVPNVFSPNDDGINDVFRAEGAIEAMDRIHGMKIYSRWGDLLFQMDGEKQGRTPGWNGFVKGKKADLGIYVYVIQWRNFRGELELITGDVLLIR